LSISADFRKSWFFAIVKERAETGDISSFKFIRGLTSETAKGLSLTLEGVDDIHSGTSRAFGMLHVDYRVTDDVLKVYLEYTTRLFRRGDQRYA
jgi:hypothetical protein